MLARRSGHVVTRPGWERPPGGRAPPVAHPLGVVPDPFVDP